MQSEWELDEVSRIVLSFRLLRKVHFYDYLLKKKMTHTPDIPI